METAKRKLSYSQNASIEIGNFIKVITRATFEEINLDLFESTIETVRKVLQDAKMNKEDVDKIVLSGGSTQIPKIRQLLKEFFVGKKLIHTTKEDVSRGIGKQAAILSGEADTKTSPLVREVNSLSLGIRIYGQRMSAIIPRNTTIPTSRSNTYTTQFDYQKLIGVNVYEGEHEIPSKNHFLDSFVLSGITRALAGVPKLKVTMNLDINGMLHVTARDEDNGSKNDIVIDYFRKRFGPDRRY